MAVSSMKQKVREILGDKSQAIGAKIDRLRALQSEARGVQRAATESPMAADDGLQDDLRMVEKALQELGADSEEKGAATL